MNQERVAGWARSCMIFLDRDQRCPSPRSQATDDVPKSGRQLGQGREGDPGWSLGAGTSLMWAFSMVMHQARGRLRAHKCARGGPMDQQALILVGLLVALDPSIQVGSMRGTHSGDNGKGEQKAHKGGGEVASAGTAHPSRVPIKGEHGRDPLRSQTLCGLFEGGFRSAVITDGSPEDVAGAWIEKMAGVHHVLLLAKRISGNGGGIFEIELDGLHRLMVQQVRCATRRLGNAPVLAQDLPDGTCRARKRNVGGKSRGVTRQVVQ